MSPLSVLARLSPAHAVYDDPILRFFGLQFLSVRDFWRLGFVWLCLLTAVGLGVVSTRSKLFEGYWDHCCYPHDAPAGTLGSCQNASHTVHHFADRRSCLPIAPLRAISLIFSTGSVLLGMWVSWGLWGEDAFQDRASKGMMQHLGGMLQKNTLTTGHVVEWIHSQTVFRLVPFMPFQFISGRIYSDLGWPKTQRMHVGCLVGGTIMAVLFFTDARVINTNYGCYPRHTPLRNLSLGSCNDTASHAWATYAHPNASETANATHKHHKHYHGHTTLFFDVCLGAWVGLHGLILALYVYTARHWTRDYAQHIVTFLRKHRALRDLLRAGDPPPAYTENDKKEKEL